MIPFTRRLIQHNLGINMEAYTFQRRPVELVFHEIFSDFNLAFEWETKIKKWSKSKKQALIIGDFELLKTLSKKNFKNRINGCISIRKSKETGFSSRCD